MRLGDVTAKPAKKAAACRSPTKQNSQTDRADSKLGPQDSQDRRRREGNGEGVTYAGLAT